MVVLAPIAAMLIQMAVSRSREYGADASGAKLLGDPRPLASALEKLGSAAGRVPLQGASPTNAHLCIVNPFAGLGGLAALFSTHPPIEERIRQPARDVGDDARLGPSYNQRFQNSSIFSIRCARAGRSSMPCLRIGYAIMSNGLPAAIRASAKARLF